MDLSNIRESIASEMGLVSTDLFALKDNVESALAVDTSAVVDTSATVVTRQDTLEERVSLLEQKFRGEGLISVKEARLLFNKIEALEDRCFILEKRIQQLLEEF